MKETLRIFGLYISEDTGLDSISFVLDISTLICSTTTCSKCRNFERLGKDGLEYIFLQANATNEMNPDFVLDYLAQGLAYLWNH